MTKNVKSMVILAKPKYLLVLTCVAFLIVWLFGSIKNQGNPKSLLLFKNKRRDIICTMTVLMYSFNPHQQHQKKHISEMWIKNPFVIKCVLRWQVAVRTTFSYSHCTVGGGCCRPFSVTKIVYVFVHF